MSLRHGQNLFNKLLDVYPKEVEYLRSSDVDPFYDDEKCVFFIKELIERILDNQVKELHELHDKVLTEAVRMARLETLNSLEKDMDGSYKGLFKRYRVMLGGKL